MNNRDPSTALQEDLHVLCQGKETESAGGGSLGQGQGDRECRGRESRTEVFSNPRLFHYASSLESCVEHKAYEYRWFRDDSPGWPSL